MRRPQRPVQPATISRPPLRTSRTRPSRPTPLRISRPSRPLSTPSRPTPLRISTPSRPVLPVVSIPTIPTIVTLPRDRVAVLIGIEYTTYASQNRLDRLPGCHLDVTAMHKLLTEHYGFDARDIHTLVDNTDHDRPTYQNIETQLQWLISEAKKPGVKHVVLYYSGHGTQQDDTSGDEEDSKDEAIVPCDFLEKGLMTDDYLVTSFLSLLPATVKCTTIFDCCNSGTLLDLPYQYKSGNTVVPIPHSKVDIKAEVITLSGCRDSQTSASAYNMQRNKQWRGAMTVALETVLQQQKWHVTAKQAIDQITNFLSTGGFTQCPVLCFNRSCDPASTEFLSTP